MKKRIQNLYTYLITNRKHQIDGWHADYKAFHAEVCAMRERLRDGYKLDASKNEPFLRKLLFTESNGIADRGQSVLSHDNFGNYIKNTDFMDCLNRFILDPSQQMFKEFEQGWENTAHKYGARKNPLLVNRVAAACTLDVSTTVDPGRFNQVFYWLSQEGLIAVSSETEGQGWYAKNVFLMTALKDAFAEELQAGDTDIYYLSQFVWMLYENTSNPFSLKKQVVKYGAPGTGKTYLAQQQTKLLFEIWKDEYAQDSKFIYDEQKELVQFHPSFSYEDFMEGLRPVLDAAGNAQLKLQNGVFKQFCIRAGKWEVDIHRLQSELPRESVLNAKKLNELLVKDLVEHRSRLTGDHWEYIFKLAEADAGGDKKLIDALPPFFFIIDEINRAELSRVFGELMFCLEYRGVPGAVKTQYANLNRDETTGMLHNGVGYTFFIPNNVYLIGTMNTIDRSVESFDFALRRRFRWEEVRPDCGVLRHHLQQERKLWMPLAEDLRRLNDVIAKEPLLGADYQVGHAYLMNLNYPAGLTVAEVRSCIWEDSIRSLLHEYLRGTGKEAELIKTFGKAFGV